MRSAVFAFAAVAVLGARGAGPAHADPSSIQRRRALLPARDRDGLGRRNDVLLGPERDMGTQSNPPCAQGEARRTLSAARGARHRVPDRRPGYVPSDVGRTPLAVLVTAVRRPLRDDSRFARVAHVRTAATAASC